LTIFLIWGLLDQSAQDQILREELQQSKISANELYPPVLERLHQQMQQLRVGEPSSSASSQESNLLTEEASAAISTYLKEAFRYARVDGAHILELVVKTALSSIRSGLLQQAADVVAPYPQLQPLVAVMGWDLLRGQTKKRRQLMELLWIRRRRQETVGQQLHSDSADEVGFSF
jgi:zinc finger FYVE domain-containing protein 26